MMASFHEEEMSGANETWWYHFTKKRCLEPKKHGGIISL